MLCFRLLSSNSSALRPAVALRPRADSVYGNKGLAFSLMICRSSTRSSFPAPELQNILRIPDASWRTQLGIQVRAFSGSATASMEQSDREGGGMTKNHLEESNKGLRDIAGLLRGEGVSGVCHDEGPHEPCVGVALKVDSAAVQPQLRRRRLLL